MSPTDAPPNISDIYAQIGLIRTPDGSFTRLPDFIPTTPASSDPIPVLTKDIPINLATNTGVRLYLPRPPSADAPATKLPVIVFYHGGGFVMASPATTLFQYFCRSIAHRIPALMVSVEYRLAPEHRLPAAYEDCVEALHWVKTTADEWLTKHADLSRCFIMGNSAGGNIAYHVGLRAVACVDQLEPLKIQGLILHQPFFGGVERTASEIRLADDKVVPLHTTDVMWDLSLPVGADHDHEYANPVGSNADVEAVEKMRDEGWKVLVTGYEGDPLVDRQIGLAKMFKDKGVDVAQHFCGGGAHGIEFFDDAYADVFFDVLEKFFRTF